MPVFIVFAIAVSMCVLCFAVGFIAALNLRIAERTALPRVGTTDRFEAAMLPTPSAPQSSFFETAPVPAPAPPVSLVPPAPPVPTVAQAHAEPAFQQPRALATRSVPLPQRRVTPQPAPVVDPVAFPEPAAPAAKVFLFGNPHEDAAAAANPGWGTTQPSAAPQLTSADIDLLPRRPQYARSDRRR